MSEQEFVKAKVIGKMFGIGVTTIHRLARNGIIPCYEKPNVGRLFKVSEVRDWIEKDRKPPKQETA